jgi:hypothetical protein
VATNINIGNQEIIWKYQTPLDSRYLSRQLTGAVGMGMVDKPRIIVNPDNFSQVLIYPPFSLFVNSDPYDSSDPLSSFRYTYKVTFKGEVSSSGGIEPIVVQTDAYTIGIGFKFDWTTEASNWGQFQVLHRDPPSSPREEVAVANNYPGVIICGLRTIDSGGTTVVPESINIDEFGDFVDHYHIARGNRTLHRFSACPLRSIDFSNQRWGFKSYGYQDAGFPITVYAQAEDMSVVKDAEPYIILNGTYITPENFARTYSYGNYVIVGYRKTYASVSEIPADKIPLVVYWSGENYPVGGISANYYPIAIVQWNENNFASKITELTELFSPSIIDTIYRKKVDTQIFDGNYRFDIFNSSPMNPGRVGMEVTDLQSEGELQVISSVSMEPVPDVQLPSNLYPIHINMYSRGIDPNTLNVIQSLIKITPEGAYYTKSDTYDETNLLQTRTDLAKYSTRQFKGDIATESALRFAAYPSSVTLVFKNTSVNSVNLPRDVYIYRFTNPTLALDVPYLYALTTDRHMASGATFEGVTYTTYYGWVRVPEIENVTPAVTGALPLGVTVGVKDNSESPGFDKPLNGDWFKVLNLDLTAPGTQGIAVFNGALNKWDISPYTSAILDGQVLSVGATIEQDAVHGFFGVAKTALAVQPLWEEFPAYYSATYQTTIRDIINKLQALYNNSYHLIKPGEFKVCAVRNLIDLIDRRWFPCNGTINPVSDSNPNMGSVVPVDTKFPDEAQAAENVLFGVFDTLRKTYPVVAQINSLTSMVMVEVAITMTNIMLVTPASGLNDIISVDGQFKRTDGLGLIDVIMADSSPQFDRSLINPLFIEATGYVTDAGQDIQSATAASTAMSARTFLMSAIENIFLALDTLTKIVLWVRSFRSLFDLVYSGQNNPSYYRVVYNVTTKTWLADENGPYFTIPYISTPVPYAAVNASAVAIVFETFSPKVGASSIIISGFSMSPPVYLVMKTNVSTASATPHSINLLPLTVILPVHASNRLVRFSYSIDSSWTGQDPISLDPDLGTVTAYLRCNDRASNPNYFTITATAVSDQSLTVSIPVKVVTEVTGMTLSSTSETLNTFGSTAANPTSVSITARLSPNGENPADYQLPTFPTDYAVTWELLNSDETPYPSSGVLKVRTTPSVPGLIATVYAESEVPEIVTVRLRATTHDGGYFATCTILATNGVLGAYYDGTYQHDGEALYS